MRAAVLATLLTVMATAHGLAAPGPIAEHPESPAIQKVIGDYARAIEAKDITLFKAVKPNLSAAEEQRARAGFAAVKSQTVRITVVSLEVEGASAVVRILRRDTINGSLVSSFPQTLRMARAGQSWGIVEIGK
jgi:hypothetical protein